MRRWQSEGNQQAGERAISLLERAEHTESGARHDHELHAQLGFLRQLSGEKAAAAEEYQMALEADPNSSLAAGDLALLRAEQHQYAEASRLWKQVFDHDPSQLGAGMNLAVVECGLGKRSDALATLDRILEFSPDDEKARAMAGEIRSGSSKMRCSLKDHRGGGIQRVNICAASAVAPRRECYA